MDLQPLVPLTDAGSLSSIDQQHPPVRKRSPWLAWIAIILTTAFLIWPPFGSRHAHEEGPSLVIQNLQARVYVAATTMTTTPKGRHDQEIRMAFGHGFLRQQLVGVVLFAEFRDHEKALSQLDHLDSEIDQGVLSATPAEREVTGLLRKQIRSQADPDDVERKVTDEDRAASERLFPELLGWSGRLALYPPNTSDHAARELLLNQARRTLFVMLGVFAFAGMAALTGVVLQLVWWVFAATGRLDCGIQPLRGDAVIYAETFAVWMAWYMALCYLIAYTPMDQMGMIKFAIPQIVGLAALGWPVIRGLRWADVRQDLGLYWGRPAWLVPFTGVGTYLAALPVVGMAMIVTLIMMQVASLFAGPNDSAAPMAHPIVEPILQGNWTVRLQLLFVAVFAAVPEEIMFRGVLYRHFREMGSSWLGWMTRVVFSTLITSFIFAAIHPQGLFGIPILMSLAMVFAIAREWRGSVVPSMIAHSLVNAGTSCVLFLLAD